MPDVASLASSIERFWNLTAVVPAAVESDSGEEDFLRNVTTTRVPRFPAWSPATPTSSLLSVPSHPAAGDPLRLVVLKVLSVLLLLLICLFGNIIMLLALRTRKQVLALYKQPPRRPNPDTLLLVLAGVSIVHGVVSSVFQTVSFIYGDWVFGDPICQLQGFTINLLNFCVIWYIALLSFERYTHRLQPQEYPLTLSRLNLRVILVGIFFLLLTAVSGPIYGWGQYTYRHELGLCALNMTSQNVVTYLALSLSVYVLVPYTSSAVWYVMLLTHKEPAHAFVAKDDIGTIFGRRSNLYVFATGCLFSLLFGLPSYIGNVLQCAGVPIDETLIYTFAWLHDMALHCAHTICCLCGCAQLRVHISTVIVCSLKSNCRHLQLTAQILPSPALLEAR